MLGLETLGLLSPCGLWTIERIIPCKKILGMDKRKEKKMEVEEEKEGEKAKGK